MPPFSVERLDHIVLRVADIERSIAFYVGILGLRVERRREDLGLVQLRAGAPTLHPTVVPCCWLMSSPGM